MTLQKGVKDSRDTRSALKEGAAGLEVNGPGST